MLHSIVSHFNETKAAIGTGVSGAGWIFAQTATSPVLANMSVVVTMCAGLVTIALGVQSFLYRKRKRGGM